MSSRVIHKELKKALEATKCDLIPLSELVSPDTPITYGVVKAGDAQDEGVPMIKVEDIGRNWSINTSNLMLISHEIAAAYKRTRVQDGDLLLSIVGTIGRIGIVPAQLEGANIFRSVGLVRLKDKRLITFIALYLESGLAQLQLGFSSRGGANKRINLADLREVKIPSIDFETATEIFDRFSTIRELLVNAERRLVNQRLLSFKKQGEAIDSVFCHEFGFKKFAETSKGKVFLKRASLLERFDIPVNHPSYTKLIHQIKASAKSGSLSDLVNLSEERFNPDEHIGQEIYYLAIGDIDGISGNIIEPQKMVAEDLPSRARRLIHAGDILVGIAGASTGTENMVVFPVTREQEGWVATTGFLVLRPRDGVDIHYVCSLLKAPFVLRQIRALLTSPAMPTISDTDFMQLAVPVTNSDARETTLIEINRVLKEERQLTIQLEQISEQIEQLLSEAKSNIFDLLDDDKFSAISARAMGIENAMGKIEEKLQ